MLCTSINFCPYSFESLCSRTAMGPWRDSHHRGNDPETDIYFLGLSCLSRAQGSREEWPIPGDESPKYISLHLRPGSKVISDPGQDQVRLLDLPDLILQDLISLTILVTVVMFTRTLTSFILQTCTIIAARRTLAPLSHMQPTDSLAPCTDKYFCSFSPCFFCLHAVTFSSYWPGLCM